MRINRTVGNAGTIVNESVNGKNHKPLQSLYKLSLTGANGVFLAHPPLHHVVELITGYGAHPHQERVSLGQREPTPAYKHNIGTCENTKWTQMMLTTGTAKFFSFQIQSMVM